jgi:nucleotide-binding universal stress UspA family protein
VWLVNGENVTGGGAILVAMDMPESETGNELNDSILSVSKSIALAEFRTLHIVHAWQLTGESHMRARGGVATNAEVDRLVKRERARRMAWLRETVNKAKSESERIATEYLAPDLHMIRGNPRKEIPRLAKRIGAQLIVLGSNTRNGLPGLLIGNTSERIVSRSDCSILVIKQPNSISPPVHAWRASVPTPDIRNAGGRPHRKSESHAH